jgi:hypothetical protein
LQINIVYCFFLDTILIFILFFLDRILIPFPIQSKSISISRSCSSFWLFNLLFCVLLFSQPFRLKFCKGLGKAGFGKAGFGKDQPQALEKTSPRPWKRPCPRVGEGPGANPNPG